MLRSAVDAIDDERSVRFELQLTIDGQGSGPTANSLDAEVDLTGDYAAGGRITFSGTASLFGWGDFDGRYMSDPGLGEYAYDATEDRWYGDPGPFEDTPEDGLHELVSNVLLNGYPATLDDRRSFTEPLAVIVKRVIDLFGGDAVELAIDEASIPDGAEASVITFEPQPDEITDIVRQRGTNDPQVEGALDAFLPELRPTIVIGTADHLPRELALTATLEDGLEESVLEGVDRVDIQVSLRLSDWDESFKLDPPKRFDDLYNFAPFGHPFD